MYHPYQVIHIGPDDSDKLSCVFTIKFSILRAISILWPENSTSPPKVILLCRRNEKWRKASSSILMPAAKLLKVA